MDDAERVREFFNQYSQRFDQIYTGKKRFWRWFDHLFRRSMYERFNYVIQALDGQENCSILDVGCGSGQYAVALAQRGARRIVGVDFAPQMVEMAKQLAAKAGVSDRCQFLTGEFLDIPLAESFDFSIAMGFFDYVKDPLPYLQKMAAVTGKGIMASFPAFSLIRSPQRRLRYALLHHYPVYFYSERKLHDILRVAGLEHAHLVRMKGGPGADMVADIRL